MFVWMCYKTDVISSSDLEILVTIRNQTLYKEIKNICPHGEWPWWKWLHTSTEPLASFSEDLSEWEVLQDYEFPQLLEAWLHPVLHGNSFHPGPLPCIPNPTTQNCSALRSAPDPTSPSPNTDVNSVKTLHDNNGNNCTAVEMTPTEQSTQKGKDHKNHNPCNYRKRGKTVSGTQHQNEMFSFFCLLIDCILTGWSWGLTDQHGVYKRKMWWGWCYDPRVNSSVGCWALLKSLGLESVLHSTVAEYQPVKGVLKG